MYCSEYGVIAAFTELISAKTVTRHREVVKGCGTCAIYFIVHTQWYIGTQGRYIVPSTQGEVTHMHFFVCSHSRTLSQVDYASEMSKCVSLNTVYLSGTIPLSNKPTLPLPKTPRRCYSQVIS